MATESKLLELAEVRFGKLTAVDKKLFTETAKGELADYSSKKSEENDPAKADEWSAERVIKAEHIQWLCTDPEAAKLVTHKGIQVNGARIEGELDLGYAEMSFRLSFSKCAFEKEINLRHAQIRALDLGGTHTGPITADGLSVMGDINLNDDFKAEGEVRLVGATIGGNLDCSGNPKGETKGGEFNNPDKVALCADGLNVKGDVFLRDGFKAIGEVQLQGAMVGGDLDCTKGEFVNSDRVALSVDGFKADGLVSLNGAVINRHFIWTGVKSPEKAGLDLRSAKIGTLWDEKNSWPGKGNLYLHGFVYDNIYDEAPKDAKRRIEWLRLNGGKEFSPQPYEQLAEVLKKSGHEETAKEILIAKNKDHIRLDPEMTIIKWIRYKFFGPTIGYGYRPWNVFWKGPFGVWFFGSIIFWLVVGSVLFGKGYYSESNLITPSKTGVYVEEAGKTNTNIHNEYPAFQFITYSIDAFVPVVDLHQTKYWMPNANKGKVFWETRWFTIRWGGILLLYLWVHIAFGWILSTLFIVGFTGLVRT